MDRPFTLTFALRSTLPPELENSRQALDVNAASYSVDP